MALKKTDKSWSKKYFSFGHRLPSILANPLFGDRKRFGLEIQENDHDWQEWQKFYMQFYQNTQKSGIGKKVNDAGYEILSQIDLSGKHVLEVGPGALPHYRYWNGKPAKYTVVDVKQVFLDQSLQILNQEGVIFSSCLTSADSLPFDDGSIDIIISFYSLEHMYPLDTFLKEFNRILRPNGFLIGAIPCEGGLAWGLGRFFTSRRYIKKYSKINPDKIYCWEHPNFADQILHSMDKYFTQTKIQYWPLRIPFIDMNLIARFIYTKIELWHNDTSF